jgi:6-phosphofructokinase 2
VSSEARGLPRVVTVTMNPAIDASTVVPHVVSERKLRCARPHYEAGGGGINVARAIRRLGGDALAFFPSGGPGGELLERLLDEEGVPRLALPIADWTRENLNVLESETRRQFRFVLPGPFLSEHEWTQCLQCIGSLRPFPSYLVASGSLPPGVPEDFYARLGRVAKERGGRLVLDSSGPPLIRALAESVFLWKPSLREFQEFTGEAGQDESAWRRRARRIVQDGHCDLLVLSLGAAGALWVTRDAEERLASPAVTVLSSVGAGDSMVAGIVWALASGQPVGEAVRFGVATAAAATMNPGTQVCRREDAERLAASVAPVLV